MLEQFVIAIQIILIDIVMAADNAIIIGLIAANFAPQNKKKIIAWGVAGAFIFRIFFAFGTDYMLEYAWIKILGGLALLWIVYNIRQDLFGKNKIKSPELKSKEPVSFKTGVYRILIADITLSFDNVMGMYDADGKPTSLLSKEQYSNELNALQRGTPEEKEAARQTLKQALTQSYMSTLETQASDGVKAAGTSNDDKPPVETIPQRNARLRVATKYPNLTNDFLSSKGVTQYKLIPSLGATETYPFIGSSEIITDITSTGKTLADNNLRVLKDGLILQSTACLFISKKKAANLQPFLNSLG